jgi:hypothetical protein
LQREASIDDGFLTGDSVALAKDANLAGNVLDCGKPVQLVDRFSLV